jgi:hypothetical protein
LARASVFMGWMVASDARLRYFNERYKKQIRRVTV